MSPDITEQHLNIVLIVQRTLFSGVRQAFDLGIDRSADSREPTSAFRSLLDLYHRYGTSI